MAEDNGAAVLDPPAQEEHDPFEGAVEPGELVLEGSGQLTLSVGGGKQPTSSTLRLTGGKIEVEGGFSKGESIVVRIEAVVNEVGFKDEHDSKTGQVIGCQRNHRARITGIAVV